MAMAMAPGGHPSQRTDVSTSASAQTRRRRLSRGAGRFSGRRVPAPAASGRRWLGAGAGPVLPPAEEGAALAAAAMHPKLLKNAHYIELGSYQYWPVLVPRGIRLYTYEQIPVSLKDNPYITDGYRAYLPSRLCLKSLFILSNETVNIWSHLLGFFLFFTLGIYDMTSVLPSARASREDFVICSICLFCFQVCMLCSVGYHLFSCHRSEKTCRRWMALDYAGISVGILGCYVSGVFYAFYCNNIHPSYLTQQWHRLRSIIFCSVSGYGVIPTIHWVWLNGGVGAPIVQEFAPRVIVMYVIALVAFLFYISKVPERYFPGQLNYLGSSHQIWHILAVIMLYWWHQSTVTVMQYRHSKPCPDYIPHL
ncbi:progestin and adipoQ receptor family member 3 isoform X4 [Monodelphis domestica]|uniref:progestin and adipoQ receptor family member 3 isoform X4 n=1 Tax=Monodelphis domestica TaxID=13616 RepID=UPI000443528C|nr:progestin and adipoQ receptor family member 3 isoform X4 [Monodelphis domestica]XP_056659221.1 progestin and adipoQ receptor family member 3 isoform X4 [Monodelphis domestica]